MQPASRIDEIEHTACSGCPQPSGDRIAIASYLGGGTVFEEAISDFAEAYADQNERDYDEMVGAVKAGHLAVEAGV